MVELATEYILTAVQSCVEFFHVGVPIVINKGYNGSLFSNSLIIHHVETKKITTMKEVWIPGLN